MFIEEHFLCEFAIGLGVGASGKNWYGFQLVFYDLIETQVLRYSDN